jgi:hypothetical protein
VTTPLEDPPAGSSAALALDPRWWPRAPRARAGNAAPPPFRHAVGTRPVEAGTWLRPRAGDAVLLRWKQRLLERSHREVVQALAGTDAAGAQVLAAVREALGPGDPPLPDVPGSLHPLDAAGRSVAEDLCVLDVRGGTPVLVAASLAMPNRWRLADKLGRPLLAVHDPVPGYAADIGTATDRLLLRLSRGAIVARANWGVVDSPALFQPTPLRPARPVSAPADVPRRLWMRVEYQTLRALPGSGCVLFTIRTAQEPLGAAVAGRPERASALAAAVEELPAEFAAYKGMTSYRQVLVEWLRTQHDGRSCREGPAARGLP